MFVQPQVAHLLHEVLHAWHVEAVLGLDELCAGGNFFGQPLCTPVEGGGKRIFRSPEKEGRGDGQFASAQVDALVAHDACGLQQLDAVEVKDPFGLRLVAGGDVVAGDTEHVADPHRGGPEQIALDGDAVAVATGDLEDRFVAGTGQQRTDGDAGHMAVGP